MTYDTFLQDLAMVVIVAGLVTILFHRLNQPLVLGYLLAGFIIGPNTTPFSLVQDQHIIELLAELGVIFLLFDLGLRFSLRRLSRVGTTAIIAAVLEILLMLLIGYGIGLGFGWGRMDSLFLGAILAISSTTIIVKALQDLGLSRERFAEIIFGILIVEDILAIAIIALLSGVAVSGSLQLTEILKTLWQLGVFLAVVLVVGLIAVPRLLHYVSRFKSDEILLITALGLCFGVSLLALRLGYSVALGAFLIGAVMAEAREQGKVRGLVEPLRNLFSAVFFVAVGMLIDPRLIIDYALPILVITVAVVLGKVATCSLGTFVAGHNVRTSLRVGMGLAQIGEFSFIIAALGLSLQVTSEFLYPIAVTVSAITTLLTPYLIKSSDPLVNRFDRVAPPRLLNYLDLYSRWITRLRKHKGEDPNIYRYIRRWVLQMSLNLVLVSALLIAAAWMNRQGTLQWLQLPDWSGGPRSVLWLGTLLLALPLLIATVLKLRALAMLIAELSVRDETAAERTRSIRAVVKNTILTTGAAIIVLWILLLSSALLPPWPVFPILLVIILLVMVILWQWFIRLYSRAQIALHETLSQSPETVEPPPPAESSSPRLLEGEMLKTLTLRETSAAAGRLIGELQVRTRSGAIIVGIGRGPVSIVNPGPDEPLQIGDTLYLIGNSEQLGRAQRLLEGEGQSGA